jgi:hypothetical protein
MDRRNFIRTTGYCTATTMLAGQILPQLARAATDDFNFLGKDFLKPVNTKLKIKPICSARVHLEAYEGPCRFAPLENLTTEAERKQNMDNCGGFMENLKNMNNPNAEILEPVLVDYPEGDQIDPAIFDALEKELHNIDLFVITYRVPGLEKFKKPVAMVGRGVTNVDVAAYYRDLGLEGYAPYLWNDFSELIDVLKTRKAIAETKALVLTNRLDKSPYGVYTSINDTEHLQSKYGFSVESVSLQEFYTEMDRIESDASLNKMILSKTEQFVNDAAAVHMETETIASDIRFYMAATNMLKKYNANAFSARCFELCGSKVPWKKKFVPCSALSMFKDQGIPATCEGDLAAMMAMAVEMYLSKKSIYMGNPLVEENNILSMHHDVPGLKMKGFDQPDLPYELVNFTESGFGATMRYDFAKDRGERVTLGRFDRSGNKMLVKSGTIDGSYNVRKVGCSLGIYIKMEDIMDYYEKSKDFGHHLSMVYGDYTRQLKRLGEVMKFEVLT